MPAASCVSMNSRSNRATSSPRRPGCKCVLAKLDDGAGNHLTLPCSVPGILSRPDENGWTRPETHARQPAPAGRPEDLRAAARADRPGAPGRHPRPGRCAPERGCLSSRALAAEMGVARTTVLQALEALAGRGISGRRAAVGRPRRARAPARRPSLRARWARHELPLPPRLSRAARALAALRPARRRLGPAPRAFRPGLPALDLFPVALWSRSSAARRPGPARDCWRAVTPPGTPGCAGRSPSTSSPPAGPAAARSRSSSPEARSRPTRRCSGWWSTPGDPVWLEDPGYLGARRAVLGASARPVPVPVDEEGLDVEAGGSARARGHGWPSSRRRTSTRWGSRSPFARRMALLRWAAVAAGADPRGRLRQRVPPPRAPAHRAAGAR